MSERLPSTLTERLPKLRPRPAESHKNDFGRALLIGGSQGMSGAITLAGCAALRGGAGLVQLGVPQGVQPIVAGYEPAYMVTGLEQDADGRLGGAAQAKILELAQNATAVAVGPGLGRSAELDALVSWLYQHLTQPLVVDADGLNALAQQPQVLRRPGGPRLLTPHPGEFARLIGARLATVDEQRERAIELAEECGLTIVLKGQNSLVTDGRQSAVNQTGNPGLATGGTGDVLTGLITALVCQQMPPWDAARLGVHLHGLAADLAVTKYGEVSLIASDLLEYLPHAILAICR